MHIPFERQRDTETDRRCGAACLAMAYRSFGVAAAQEDLWKAITSSKPQGAVRRRTARTHRLAADAIRRGLDAVVLRVAAPSAWLIRLAGVPSLRVILCHRVRPDSAQGHFSILVDADDRSITLHDPRLGPNRRLPLGTLLELWEPTPPPCEITPRMAVAIAMQSGERQATCLACGQESPVSMTCPRCRRPAPMRPHAALGCLTATCSGRLWEKLFCPACDAVLAPR